MLLCVSCAACPRNVWSIVMKIDPDYRPLIGPSWSPDLNTGFSLVNLAPQTPHIGWSCPEMNWWPWFLSSASYSKVSQLRPGIGQSEALVCQALTNQRAWRARVPHISMQIRHARADPDIRAGWPKHNKTQIRGGENTFYMAFQIHLDRN